MEKRQKETEQSEWTAPEPQPVRKPIKGVDMGINPRTGGRRIAIHIKRLPPECLEEDETNTQNYNQSPHEIEAKRIAEYITGYKSPGRLPKLLRTRNEIR
jgi:hypothetical protein